MLMGSNGFTVPHISTGDWKILGLLSPSCSILSFREPCYESRGGVSAPGVCTSPMAVDQT